MKLIGIVGSGSTTTYAPIIVHEEQERFANEEQLVIIKDPKRNLVYLGVLRNVKRYEPFLSIYRRTSYVDNPELADTGTLPHTGAYAFLIGTITGSKEISETVLPPNPGSKVYAVEKPDDLNLKLHGNLEIGAHKYSGLILPLNSEGLPYHIAVIGATGSGKSRLVKAFIDEIVSKTNYNVLVFDHSGVDYVHYYENKVINGSDIVLSFDVITDIILERTGLDKKVYEPYVILTTIAYAYSKISEKASSIELMDLIGKVEVKQKKAKQYRLFQSNNDLQESILETVGRINYNILLNLVAKYSIEWNYREFKKKTLEIMDLLKAKENTKVRLSIALDVKLGQTFFNMLSNRKILPENIVNKLNNEGLLVIDLSMEDSISKKYIVSSIMDEIWKRIEEKREPVRTVAVIDEAHNYACRFCGEPHKTITRTVREGRKWGFGLILATQRAIDIDPEIRGNINTWLFSKLQTPSDFNEISAYTNLAGISESSLAILEKREFYVAGLMNPLKIPVLVKVREVR